MTFPLEPSAPPSFFPPSWAGGWGEDTRGFFSTLAMGQIRLEMRWIPPGRFTMGSPDTERGRFSDEGPQHEVILTRGFWMASTPFTQEQYRAVTKQSPSYFKGENLPVEQVSWIDLQEFLAKLNQSVRNAGALADSAFRLPTEAEWEHACRAGTIGAFNDGSECTKPDGADPKLTKLGWHAEGTKGMTHPVGQLLPNAWGLYDMHGNVWEWCADGKRLFTRASATDPVGPCEAEAWRVVRGGSCWFNAGSCRSAYRLTFAPDFRFNSLGFRLAAGQPVQSGVGGLKEVDEGRGDLRKPVGGAGRR